MNDEEWTALYHCLQHGDEEHKAWLRGMIQGWASCHEGRAVWVSKSAPREPELLVKETQFIPFHSDPDGVIRPKPEATTPVRDPLVEKVNKNTLMEARKWAQAMDKERHTIDRCDGGRMYCPHRQAGQDRPKWPPAKETFLGPPFCPLCGEEVTTWKMLPEAKS